MEAAFGPVPRYILKHSPFAYHTAAFPLLRALWADAVAETVTRPGGPRPLLRTGRPGLGWFRRGGQCQCCLCISCFFSFSPHRPENFCIFLIPFRIFVFCRQWTFILAHHMQVSLFSLKPPTQALFPASLTRTLHRSSIPRVEIGGCTGPSVWGVCQFWTNSPGRSPAPPPKGLFFLQTLCAETFEQFCEFF